MLLVDDEKDIVELLQYNLEQEGFEVFTANDGVDALTKLLEYPDLVILDVMMPVMDGFEVCRRIRNIKDFRNTPVIFLTAKSSEADEIRGLELGANDYIQKPISPKKLIARVKSNLRKTEAPSETKTETIVKLGPLFIDKDKYIVNIDGKEKVFPKKEFEILFFLANNPGRVFSREDLLKEIWGTDAQVFDRTIDVHIRKIREKLDNHQDLIETIKGVGYRFKNVE
ncbi:MAG: DNA-binding response regulator [Ignavibacteriales bacterium]|nr:MAG: DNA-binding response regulator [Ignavibacteriales bacterium]